jgi:GTPases
LDEVREADLLVHVVDISHESFEDHVDSVNQILAEIDSNDKPTIMVFNKIDNFSYVPKADDDLTEMAFENYSLEDWKRTWMSKTNYPTLFISATEKDNLEELRKTIYDEVKEIHTKRFPYNNFLFQYYEEEVEEEDAEESDNEI